MVRSAYSFTFDPYVHDIFQMHNLMVHELDDLYDSLSCIEEGGKSCQHIESLACDVSIVVTSDVVMASIWQISLIVLMLMLL